MDKKYSFTFKWLLWTYVNSVCFSSLRNILNRMSWDDILLLNKINEKVFLFNIVVTKLLGMN